MKPDLERIYEFFGLTITGRGHGEWVKAQCPLPSHEDNNPSASVNTDEGLWNCHACAEHGDAYDIIKEHEGVTRWADLKRRADEITGGDGSSVSQQRDGSSLLSSRPRSRPGRRQFTPPWSGL